MFCIALKIKATENIKTERFDNIDSAVIVSGVSKAGQTETKGFMFPP